MCVSDSTWLSPLLDLFLVKSEYGLSPADQLSSISCRTRPLGHGGAHAHSWGWSCCVSCLRREHTLQASAGVSHVCLGDPRICRPWVDILGLLLSGWAKGYHILLFSKVWRLTMFWTLICVPCPSRAAEGFPSFLPTSPGIINASKGKQPHRANLPLDFCLVNSLMASGRLFPSYLSGFCRCPLVENWSEWPQPPLLEAEAVDQN